jgi:hypothetical protein
MPRLSYRRAPMRCTCQGSEIGPSTHRAPAHRPECPHSTLHDTTQRYAQVARKLRAKTDAQLARRELEREARRTRNARPATRIRLD